MSAAHDSTRPGGPRRPQLGLLARPPLAGRVKTRLVPGLDGEQAARLYAAFLEDMTQLGTGPWERTLFWDGSPSAATMPAGAASWRAAPQAAGTLGDRLEAAFADLFGRGAPVLLLGSDHPDLPPALLEEARIALTDCDCVLGPTLDGGYYAIGLAAPAPGLLQGIAWSMPTVFVETLRAATTRGLRVRALPPWSDVDRWEDVAALAHRLTRAPESAPATWRALGALGLLAKDLRDLDAR